eukprot:scaffold4991_cov417-Prasinococcus_capsulatus_cf.AAC.9
MAAPPPSGRASRAGARGGAGITMAGAYKTGTAPAGSGAQRGRRDRAGATSKGGRCWWGNGAEARGQGVVGAWAPESHAQTVAVASSCPWRGPPLLAHL